jgi:hypothetical protein
MIQRWLPVTCRECGFRKWLKPCTPGGNYGMSFEATIELRLARVAMLR